MKKKKDEEITFSNDEEELRFVKMMERSGVLSQTASKKNKDLNNPVDDDEIRFDLTTDPFNDASAFHNSRPKYSKIPAKVLKRRAQKKIKVDRNIIIDARLDLHGETLKSSQFLLDKFLRRSILRKDRVILIITGKGLNSGEEGAILKNVTWDWLHQNSGNFKEFRIAPGFLGGEGAILVRLL